MLSNDQLLSKFKLSMDSDFERLETTTINANMNYVSRFLKIVDLPAIDITQSAIQRYMLDLKCLDGTKMNIDSKQAHLSAIKKFYKFLYNTDDADIVPLRYLMLENGTLIPKQNPVLDMPSINASKTAKLERNPRKKGLTREQTKDFLNSILKHIQIATEGNCLKHKEYYLRDYAMCSLMLEVGLRISDVIALDRQNFDLKNGKLSFTIEKTKSNHQVYISRKMCNIITIYWKKREDDLEIAFLSSHKKRMRGNKVNDRLKKYAVDAGISPDDVSCHILRHTCGALMYEQTKDIEFVKELLGHGSINTTQRYIYNDDVDEAMKNNIEIFSNNIRNI